MEQAKVWVEVEGIKVILFPAAREEGEGGERGWGGEGETRPLK